MAGVWFTVAFWSLHFKAKFSNPSTQCSQRRLSSSWPHFSVLNTHHVHSVSFPLGRTDPVPIILKYDVMGMGRMEMEVLNSVCRGV